MGRRLIIVRAATILLFILILAIGLFIHDDYGISTDEVTERKITLMNYRYISETLFQRNIPKLAHIPDLSNPPDWMRGYGSASQIPPALVEDLHYFQQEWRDVFIFKHLWTFIIYYLALICFYFIAKIISDDYWISLVGVLLFWLYPRFFAESYYNIKDMIFVSWYVISVLCVYKVFQTKKLAWYIGFALTCALAINARIMGIMLPLALVAFMIIDDLGIVRKSLRQPTLVPVRLGRPFPWVRILQYGVVTVGTMLFYVVITPASWENPVHYIYSTLLLFADYDIWNGTMVFAGELITRAEVPWYYIPVWMGITIPITYILFFLIGLGTLAFIPYKQGWSAFSRLEIWFTLLLFIAPLIGIILLGIKIYIGWKQVYFLFVPFIIIVVYGIKSMLKTKSKHIKILTTIILVISLTFQVGWIIVNHPYQFVYFNAIGRPMGDQFDRDYWRVAQTDIYKHILSKDDSPSITIYSGNAQLFNMLPSAQASVFNAVSSNDLNQGVFPDYIYESYRNRIGNTVSYPGYREVYIIKVDGFKIASLFKREDTPAAP